MATQTPERLSLPVLAALCDIFDCTPADLIATKAENQARKAVAGDKVVDMNTTIRPNAPASASRNEPVLQERRSIRTLAHPGMRPVWSAGSQGCELGRADLPHLLRHGSTASWTLYRMRR